MAAAELLVRRGATVTLTDVKSTIGGDQRLRDAGVVLELGAARAETFDRADLVVTSPGVPLDVPEVLRARQRGTPVIGELELASRWLKGRIIAITGTKGKSTTTTVVGRMLESAGYTVLIGGNIGVPLSSQVDASTIDTLHVIEASSFQLEATDTFHPWIAALLNFSPDHLDRHASETTYGAAKARIFANQTAADWAVVNGDNAAALAVAAPARARLVKYGVVHTNEAAIFADRGFIWQRTADGETPLIPLTAIRLAGRHMLSNVTAAAAISSIAGAGGDAMTLALDRFTGLEHVMEPVDTIAGVRFVNDSKATNVDAAARSIESFDKVVAIVGGRYKGGQFEDLEGPLRTRGRGVVAIGEARSRVRAALEGVVPLIQADSMGEAVRRAFDLAQPDGVVLLAPACSSFDMFVDYADRGRAFKAEVARLRRERS
jgi:UDP-N-acetylmuramoylalanine--D-glutamate ligase